MLNILAKAQQLHRRIRMAKLGGSWRHRISTHAQLGKSLQNPVAHGHARPSSTAASQRTPNSQEQKSDNSRDFTPVF